MTVAAWIRRCAQRHPDKLAYVDGERRITYAQFVDRMRRHANGLYAAGLKRGDRVATLTNNHVECVEAVGAAATGGFVHVPVNFRSVPREIAYVVNHCGASLLFVRWSPGGDRPSGHVETETLAWGKTAGEAQTRLESLSLYDVKAALDEAIARAPGVW